MEKTVNAKWVCDELGISRRTLFRYTHWYKDRPPLLSFMQVRGGPVKFDVAEVLRFKEMFRSDSVLKSVCGKVPDALRRPTTR